MKFDDNDENYNKMIRFGISQVAGKISEPKFISGVRNKEKNN